MITERAMTLPFDENSGFTLLEVMVAIAIIAIVLVSVIRLQGQTVGMNESFRFYTQAPLLASARMSEALADPEGAGGSATGDFGEAFAGYSWEIDRETVTIDITDSDEIELEKIDVIITRENGAMTYRLRHFFTPAPEM